MSRGVSGRLNRIKELLRAGKPSFGIIGTAWAQRAYLTYARRGLV